MTAAAELPGRVALVTGASRGLGYAIASGLAAAGAVVYVASRKEQACADAAARIEAGTGGQAFPLPLHVGQWDRIEPALDEIARQSGRLDILVNNAGIAPVPDRLEDASEALFDKTIDVNLKGPFRLMALAGARMARSGGGSIVNVSSLGSWRPGPDEAIYCAAKAGLNALTAAFAQAYAPSVRVNCVLPGAFGTDMARGWDSGLRARVLDGLPAGRMGNPEEIVGLVLHLAGDRSSYTTGAMIPVDGGRSVTY